MPSSTERPPDGSAFVVAHRDAHLGRDGGGGGGVEGGGEWGESNDIEAADRSSFLLQQQPPPPEQDQEQRPDLFGEDDDDDDDDDDDEESWLAVIRATCSSVVAAARRVESDTGRATATAEARGYVSHKIRGVSVAFGRQARGPRSDDGADERGWAPGERRAGFRALVAAIHGHPRIRDVSLNGTSRTRGEAGDDDVANADNGVFELPSDDDLGRLVGEVLPNHRALRNVSVGRFHWPRYVRLLAEGLSHRLYSLTVLTLTEVTLDRECLLSIQRMLRRNVRIEQLHVVNCRVESLEGWRIVCEGAAANRHLLRLRLEERRATIPPGWLDPAVGGAATLGRLQVTAGSFSDACIASLAGRLKHSTALFYLELAGSLDAGNLPVLEEVLRAHNFRLRYLFLRGFRWEQKRTIQSLLLRNREVLRFHATLEDQHKYVVPCRSLWPWALHPIATFPTLVYRFVRKGNLHAFAEQMAAVAASKKKRKYAGTE